MSKEKSKVNVLGRMERLPLSRIHYKFLMLVMGGEWVETLMLLGNGGIATVLSTVLFSSLSIAVTAITTAFFLGETLGSVLFGLLSDMKGRRTVFLVNLLLFGVGMLIAGFMSNFYAISALIFVAGIGVGGEFPLVDSYTSEMMPGKFRGRGVALVYTLAVTSAPVIAIVTYLSSHPLEYYSWRIPLWFMGVAALVVWALRTRLDESPRWLETKGRVEEADEIVRKWEDSVVREGKELPDAEEVDVEEKRSSVRELFSKELRKRTIMMLVFQFFQSGIFYGFVVLTPSFLLAKGISLVNTLLFSIVIDTGFLAGSVINYFVIDKVDRKYGIIGSSVLAGVLGTAFALAPNVPLTVALGFLVAATLWNFSNFFHTYQAEIFPTRVRSTGAGLVYSVSRFSTSILVLLIAAFFLPRGLLATFGIIWVFIAIVSLDIGLLGPRTTGRKLEDISK
ncbi:MFS transporter [Sulfuracidifex tepidarius]|uniref:Sialic acid transporter n=1 Tax=Sulfuracidifex tepidarius TaxID=1294262 RepID=A0A510DTB6_9CREN|nr:MFS transporter [Sulfuracidifex tepidarius]BBG23395.1 Putative sialic acid transporter [Sulfuracidifex tepidarius]BBG26148.1 Putative sialic acid transporter [Sulfuracidifex tepidarius]